MYHLETNDDYIVTHYNDILDTCYASPIVVTLYMSHF
jgi:hypothetical protein